MTSSDFSHHIISAFPQTWLYLYYSVPTAIIPRLGLGDDVRSPQFQYNLSYHSATLTPGKDKFTHPEFQTYLLSSPVAIRLDFSIL
jgi:hypothetical protein